MSDLVSANNNNEQEEKVVVDLTMDSNNKRKRVEETDAVTESFSEGANHADDDDEDEIPDLPDYKPHVAARRLGVLIRKICKGPIAETCSQLVDITEMFESYKLLPDDLPKGWLNYAEDCPVKSLEEYATHLIGCIENS